MSGDSIEETYGSNAVQVSWKVTKLLFADGDNEEFVVEGLRIYGIALQIQIGEEF